MDKKKVALKKRHIIAIGGGSAAAPHALRAYFKYIFSLSGKIQPKVLFVNTAQGDADSSTLFLYRNASGLPCEITHLGFFKRTPQNLTELTTSHDVIFVGGGNTKSAIAVWREYGFDQSLCEAWEKGIILSGSSAGGICWFDQCLTDSYDTNFTALKGLSFLPGSCCPHYDGEKGRRETFHRLICSGALPAGYAIDECAALHFKGLKCSALSAKPDATCYQVALIDGKVVEKPLATTFLN
jgi:peptidase E